MCSMNIQRECRIKQPGHWTCHHVMDLALKLPVRIHALIDVFDEDRIEIDGTD